MTQKLERKEANMENTQLTIIEDRVVAIQQLETAFELAVRQRELLEKYIRERLKPDRHYYSFGDDPKRKPSLTKEGAELICLPHALKARYSWLSGPQAPPPDGTPYQLVVKCELEANGKFAGEGIGSASSYITTRAGDYKQHLNDPGLCHNATLKMAQKSAYIAATLNATAASEFFTQDMEDDQTGGVAETEKGHWCGLHSTPFFKKGKMKAYAHPIKNAQGQDTGEWCHEHKGTPPPAPEPPQKATAQAPEGTPAAAEATTGVSGEQGEQKRTPEQNKEINVLFHERQFQAAEFQEYVAGFDGAVSTADLTEAQAAELIDWLETKPVKEGK